MQRTGLSVQQLQELIEIFSLVDIDHGGTISTDELATLMKTLGLSTNKVGL
jgi:Ca2+-binding EF-hand superfamily protein